jgi:hypothetical protein
MAVTTAVREGVRKRARAAGKTPTTAGINATVAKNRLMAAKPVVIPPPAFANSSPIEKTGPAEADRQAAERAAARIEARREAGPRTGWGQPNANAVANANENARFKRPADNPAAKTWLEGLRTAVKTYSTANPKPAGMKGMGRRRGRRPRVTK